MSIIPVSCASSKTTNPTITPTTTISQIFVISKEMLETIPPDDIVDEISFYDGGSGGGGIDCRIAPKGPVEKMEFIEIDLCPPPLAEEIFVEITKPNGETNLQPFISSSKFIKGLFLYRVPWEEQTGKYTFKFYGKEFDEFIFSVDVIQPVGPQVYFSKNEQGEQRLFYQFAPYEKIRVFVYNYDDDSFIGWTTIYADESGSAVLLNALAPENENDSFRLAIVGEESGQVVKPWVGKKDIVCKGAPNPQHGVNGSYIIITADSIIGYKSLDALYSSTSIPNETESIAISRGTILVIPGTHGPICKDSTFWYLSYSLDGVWVPEGKGEDYYFEIVE